MKKKYLNVIIVYGIIVSLVSLSLANSNTFEYGDNNVNSIIFNIITDSFDIRETEKGHEIDVDNFGRLLISGKPNMPSKIFSFAIPFFALTKTMNGGLRGLKKIHLMIITDNILWRIVPLICVLIMYYCYNLQAKNIAYTFVLGTIVMFLTAGTLLCIEIKKITDSKKKGNILYCFKKITHFSLPLSIFNLTNQLRSRSDIFLLGFFLSSASVGLYSVATTLISIPTIFMGAVTMIFNPLISELYGKGDLGRLKNICILARDWLFVLGFPIFLFLIFFPQTSIDLLFGASYQKAWIALVVLGVGFFIQSTLGPVGAIILAMGNSQIVMKINIASVIIVIILNITLIPFMGLTGAALASSIALVFQQLAMFKIVRKKIPLPFLNKHLLIYALYCLFLAVGLKILAEEHIQSIFSLAGISMLYYLVSLTGVVIITIRNPEKMGLDFLKSQLTKRFLS